MLRCSLFPLVFIAACSSPPDIPTAGNGELHQGTFIYAGAAGIAAGADFDLAYSPSSPQITSLEPNTSFFAVTPNGQLHANRAGYGVVLVLNPRGEVIDFVNLHVKTIATIAITGADTVAVNDTRVLQASAFDAAGEALAGTLPLEWESADPAVATVTVTAGVATLHAIAAGTTQIRVIAGASTGAIEIGVGS